jgi:hypothetical protein
MAAFSVSMVLENAVCHAGVYTGAFTASALKSRIRPKQPETPRDGWPPSAAQCVIHSQGGAVKLGARIAFGMSLVANVAGLYLLLPQSAAVTDAPPAELPLTEAPAAPPAAALDARGYRDALLARGVSPEETKPLVLARLTEGLALSADPRAADEYWRSTYTEAAAESLGRRVAAEERVRATLLDLYGAPARRDPVFAPLFAPLDSRYAFLTSEQQLALQKLQIERLLVRAKTAPSSPSPLGSQRPPAGASATAAVLEDLRARLGPAAATEYAYRFSPLAEQLRSAGVELSNAEFRGAFEALLTFESATDAQTFAQTRAALRSLLGDARFTQLWAARDPFYATLVAAGRQQGLADGAVLAAYAIFNDAQDRFAAVAHRYEGVDPERAGTEAREIQQDVQQRLVALLGEEAATAMSRATAHLSVSLQQPSSTNLRE